MKTVVIKMGDLAPDEQGAMVYPVQLFLDDGDPDWLTKPVGKPASIPQNFSLPKPMLDHMKKPLDGSTIRDLFLNENYLPGHVRDCGEYLYQLLFQGSVGDEWKRLHLLYPKEEARKSEGLRTILDIKPDDLRWLPWELIRQDTLTWFIDAGNPFSRGTLEQGLKSKSSMWPIRILVVVGSDAKDVNTELELKQMEAAFIKSPVPVDWYVCLRPKKEALKPLIEKYKPQIIHFIGHGRQVNNYSYLELTDAKEEAGSQEWTADDVAIDLQNWKPRLAFINACRSSNAGAQENSWDIAHTFANQGVPAVVGMQADIQGAAAAGFSRTFYESIFAGLSVDRALAEARSAVRNLPGFSLRNRDWALATLYLRQLPDQILNMGPQIDPQMHAKYKADERLQKVRDFVGRFTQRRELWHGVDEIEDHEDQFKRACIVVGNKDMGKTSLLQASVKICALRGRRICYVDIGYNSTKEVVEILDIIRKGDEKSSEILCKPLPTEPFNDFDNKYGPVLADPEAVKNLAGDNNLCDQLFDAYKKALVTIAATTPLILVLDHLNVIWQTFNPVLVERLLLPIAQGELANCRLLLACSVDDFEQHLLKDLIKAAHAVPVGKWHVDRFVPLMHQICLYNNIEVDEVVEGIIQLHKSRVKTEFEPRKLREVVDSLK
jgi:hypothetical protein